MHMRFRPRRQDFQGLLLNIIQTQCFRAWLWSTSRRTHANALLESTARQDHLHRLRRRVRQAFVILETGTLFNRQAKHIASELALPKGYEPLWRHSGRTFGRNKSNQSFAFHIQKSRALLFSQPVLPLPSARQLRQAAPPPRTTTHSASACAFSTGLRRRLELSSAKPVLSLIPNLACNRNHQIPIQVGLEIHAFT